jgi:hypothetical protein
MYGWRKKNSMTSRRSSSSGGDVSSASEMLKSATVAGRHGGFWLPNKSLKRSGPLLERAAAAELTVGSA